MRFSNNHIEPVNFLIPKILVILAFTFSIINAKAQVTIFTEGFEHNSSMPAGWTQEYVYDTLNWIFTNGGNSSHPASAHNGSFNALLYYGGIHRTTKLITPPLNLNLYNNLQLKFWHAQEDYSGDQDYLRIYYKTSASGSWTVIDSFKASVSIWTQRTISLPNPGSSYYVAFEGEARYGYGVVVDDVVITGNVAMGLDIGLSEIESPTIFSPGNNTLKINYKNFRSDTIYNADFGYKLDNNAAVIDTNYGITDTLFSDETKTYTFSTALNISQGNHYIKIWVNKPNRTLPDNDPTNDTLTLNFHTGIKDTFHIDGTGNGDYISFSAAIAELNYGVTGPTVFIVHAGTYTERILIGDIPGASATNTITFAGVDKDSVTLTYYGTSSANRATLVLKGADYVTFKNIKIQNTAPAYAVCVLLRNQSNYNTFSNCILQNTVTAYNVWSQIILMSQSEGSVGMNGDNGNYNLFENNEIIGGYYGARIHGTNTAMMAINNKFVGNIFTYQYVYGIYCYYQQGLLVKGNTLKSFRANSAISIISYYGTSSEINGNTLHPGRIGIYLYLENYYYLQNSSLIINNMISNFRDPVYQMGIFGNNRCNRLNILHNSIWVKGSYNHFNYAAIRLYYYCDNSVIKNNILSSTNYTYILNLYYASAVSIDYNDYYYDTTSSIKFYNNSTYSNFSTFKVSSSYISVPHDQNSFDNVNPGFISYTNLHLDTNNTPSLMAPYFSVLTDIDNEARDSTFGCNLGADEIYHPPKDLDIVSIIKPSVLGLGSNNVSIILRNLGTDTLVAQTIHLSYAVNGGSWVNDSVTLTSPLIPFAIKHFSFSTPWNVTAGGTYNLCARIYPQISNDPDSGDSLCVSKCVGLSDTLYIEPYGSGDFTSFNSALTALNGCGLSGPVHIIVKPGIYVERVLIGEIPGASGVNTITFAGVDKDSVTLIYAGISGQRSTLVFDGADHVKFMNIKIQNNGNVFATAAFFRNGADSNTISNCYLIVPNSSSANINAIIASNAENTNNGYGNTANYNLIENNIITGGYYGVRFNGTDKRVLCYENRFIGNTFKNQYYYGIYMIYQGKEVLKFNSISNLGFTYAYGIYNYYCKSSNIDGNNIKPGRYGIMLYRENNNFPNASSNITNNMISNFNDLTYQTGIYAYYNCYKLKILHNSIWVNGSSTSPWYTAIRLYYLIFNSVVKNNILTSTGNSYLISLYHPRTITIDYNDYYYPNNTGYKFYNHAYFTNLASFKNSTYYLTVPHDTNSYDNINPGFKSQSDLHLIDTAAGLEGDTALNITWDVDGDFRCTPTVGADEAGPIADFSINDSIQCQSGNSFVFTNGSKIGTGTLTYLWNFGDGSSTTSTGNPSHSYTTDSTFEVKLKVTSNRGCIDSISKNTYVYPSPSTVFSVNDSVQCYTNNNFMFTNSSSISSGSVTYNWTFGDGYSANISSPSHSYITTDTFNVTLAVVSNLGCLDTVQKSVYVHPEPYADFSINSDSQCFNENNFVFTNNTSITSGSLTYHWYFGDNIDTTIASPSHTYSTYGNYLVKLKSTSGLGCVDSMQKFLVVHPSPQATFSINDSSQCLTANSFTFTNASSLGFGTLSYNWNFDNGNSSIIASPTHSYLSVDTYSVKLTATSNLGCNDTLRKNVYLNPMPVAGFSINDTTQCFNENNFTFTNSSIISSGSLSYTWKFGNNNSSSDSNPNYSYNSSDTFYPKLVSTSSFGCLDSIQKTVYVYPSPVSAFTINDSGQCISGNYFSFTNGTTISSGTLTYQWNFGDGSSSANTNTSHSYSSNDTFQVTLTANSNLGCADSITKNVYVLPGPITSFAINDSIQCLNENYFSFYDSSSIGGSAFSNYYWDFGDGNSSSLSNPSHSYLNDGSYQVKLTINSGGCLDSMTKSVLVNPSPNVDFSINDTLQCFNSNLFDLINGSSINSGSLTFLWNFGDGTTSTSANLSHTYNSNDTFQIKLIANSNLNCKDSITKSVYIYPSPVASYTVNDTAQCFGSNLFIFNNNSNISSGSLTYFWNFDDGSTTTTTNPSHSFYKYDTFHVKLNVTSNLGCTDTMVGNLYVYPGPTADFSINDSTQCLNINDFYFNNTSIIGAATPNYKWYFGDNNTSIQTNPNHSYLTQGIFTVKLVVKPDTGCRDSIEKNVYTYYSPTSNFSVNDSSQCLNDNNFTFTNRSTIDTGSLTFLWDFRDGNTSSATNPSHVYSTAKFYNVKLISTSSLGCWDSFTKTIFVREMPTADFSINVNSQCLDNNSFEFTNNSVSNIIANNWSFGDGNNSILVDPVHFFLTNDTFRVDLFVQDTFGCMDSTYKLVYINPMPKAQFSINNNPQCLKGNNFIITNSSSISSGILNYYWDFDDGSNATIANPSHSYSNTGTYKMTLKAISGMNCIDSSDIVIQLHPSANLGFTINDNSQCLNTNNFQFTNTSSISSGTLTYQWDFGDYFVYNNAHASHAYTIPNVYEVKLIGTSDKGCKDTITKDVYVNPLPMADFTINSNSQCFVGNNFLYSNTSTIASGSINYNWDFGDGNSSTDQNPSGHIYTIKDTTLTVKMIATSFYNCVDAIIKTITIFPNPHVFIGDTFRMKANEAKQLDAGPNFVTYTWNTGATSRQLGVNGALLGNGTYLYWVTVTDSNNCPDSDSIVVVVGTGINGILDLSSKSIVKIYPNPSEGVLNIEIINTERQNFTLEISSTDNKLIYKHIFDKHDDTIKFKIDIKDQAAGVYFVRIYNEQFLKIEKLILGH